MAINDGGKKSDGLMGVRTMTYVSLKILLCNQELTPEDIKNHLGVLEKVLECPKTLFSPKGLSLIAKAFELHDRPCQAAAIYLKIAELLVSKAESVKAILAYRKVLELDSKNLEVYLAIAEIFLSLGLLPEAENQRKLYEQLVSRKKQAVRTKVSAGKKGRRNK